MTLAYPDALNNDTVPHQVHDMRLQNTTASRALSNTCLYENDVSGPPDLRGLADLEGLHFAATTVWRRGRTWPLIGQSDLHNPVPWHRITFLETQASGDHHCGRQQQVTCPYLRSCPTPEPK